MPQVLDRWDQSLNATLAAGARHPLTQEVEAGAHSGFGPRTSTTCPLWLADTDHAVQRSATAENLRVNAPAASGTARRE